MSAVALQSLAYPAPEDTPTPWAVAYAAPRADVVLGLSVEDAHWAWHRLVSRWMDNGYRLACDGRLEWLAD